MANMQPMVADAKGARRASHAKAALHSKKTLVRLELDTTLVRRVKAHAALAGLPGVASVYEQALNAHLEKAGA